jgi:peptidoglycan DL-endopeptidase CwlO
LVKHTTGRVLRAEAAVTAVAIGAVGAAFGIAAPSAQASDFPSWSDVQAARRSASTANTEVEKITKLVIGLQTDADAAGRTAQIAAEKYLQAKIAVSAAKARSDAIAKQSATASKTAATSRMRAGLLAAHLARQGGGELSLDLVLNASKSSDLLYQLSTVSQLSDQSQSIYKQAVADQNVAKSLGAQAKVAAAALQTREDAAATAFHSASVAASAAQAAVTKQEANQARLTEQVAELRGTSSSLAASYIAGVQEQQENAAHAAAAAPSASSSSGAASSGSSSSSTGLSSTPSSTPSSTAASSGATATTAPTSDPSAPVSTPTTSAPTGGTPSAPSAPVTPAPPTTVTYPSPNTAEVAKVLAYARAHIGDAYQFAGAGPTKWDCSGLTMMSYAAVGIAIGGHSATAQYDTAKAESLLVPYAQVQPGDLIFYTDGGGDMYHVAIYSGGGMMIEAPYDGVPVREVAVRSYQRVSQVARFTG